MPQPLILAVAVAFALLPAQFHAAEPGEGAAGIVDGFEGRAPPGPPGGSARLLDAGPSQRPDSRGGGPQGLAPGLAPGLATGPAPDPRGLYAGGAPGWGYGRQGGARRDAGGLGGFGPYGRWRQGGPGFPAPPPYVDGGPYGPGGGGMGGQFGGQGGGQGGGAPDGGYGGGCVGCSWNGDWHSGAANPRPAPQAPRGVMRNGQWYY